MMELVSARVSYKKCAIIDLKRNTVIAWMLREIGGDWEVFDATEGSRMFPRLLVAGPDHAVKLLTEARR